MDAKTDKTTWALTKAIEGLAARQAAIASNIANVDTPGFKATRVSFEQQLQRALQTDRGPGGDGEVRRDPQPEVQVVASSFRNDHNGVDIDEEMVMLADTTLRYESVTRLLSLRLAALRNIINDGRR